MAKLYGYVRVSTVGQLENSSLTEQRNVIQGLAQMKGRRVEQIFEDPAVSGSKPFIERESGRLLLDVLRPGDALVICKMDRGFRNTQDCLATIELLKAKQVDLYLADMGVEPVGKGAVGKLILTMLAAVAEFERATIAERMAMGRNTKRENNGHTGGEAPFGYRVVGEGKEAKLEPISEQQSAIKFIVQSRKQKRTYRDIAAQVNSTLPELGKFSHQKIKRILDREGVK